MAKKLNNDYFIMRHGESEANQKGIILSNPERGVKQYGLTETGKRQAEAAARSNQFLDNHTIVISSDFKRTRETAEIVVKTLKTRPVQLSPLLRERNFGGWEGASNSDYEKVWAGDSGNPDNKENGVESPNEVGARVALLLAQLEDKHKGKKILLVSHGDTLQIFQASLMGNPSGHRGVQEISVSEIRRLKI